MQKAFLAIGIIMLIFLLGCVQPQQPPVQQNVCSNNLGCENGFECIEGKCEKIEPIYTYGEVGDIVKDARLELQVDSFEFVSEFAGKNTQQKFLAINFSVKNISERNISLTNSQFEVILDQGTQKQKFVYVRSLEKEFIDLKEIKPNETRTGVMVFEVSLEHEKKQLNFVLTDKEETADFGGTLVKIKQPGTALVLSGKKLVQSTESFDVNLSIFKPKQVKEIKFTVAYEKDKLLYESLVVNEAFEVVNRKDEGNYFIFELKPRDINALSTDSQLVRFSFRPKGPGLAIISINDSDLINSEGNYESHEQYNLAVFIEEG
ncbi:MAG: DUF4352 domain-containing protein [archaeon]|nr:DUF4352 domain-containing protein [archaeon]